MELRTLQRVVQFARMYPERPADGLSWGHYRELLRVRDAQARQWYGAQAATQGWTMRALAAAVKGDAFEVERGTGKGTGKGTLVRPKVATPFLFAGEVLRVLDGDTVEMRLDLGFDVWRVQPIRFAGVDAAPVQTAAGAAARDYVLERLCRAPWTVVMTEQYDIHMRYVGHVFYAHREMTREEVFARGRYLNGELLDRGLAQRYA